MVRIGDDAFTQTANPVTPICAIGVKSLVTS
jgi:hypothetical protein